MTQSTQSCESFEWQWTEERVWDSEATLYRKIFEAMGVWHDFYDGKVVADVGSGMGRFTWALAHFTKARRIISVELSPKSVAKQRSYITDPRVEFMNADIAAVRFTADVIYCAGVIQHTQDPAQTLKNLIGNLNEGGELFVSFYQKTLATRALEPLRMVLSRLPRKVLWLLTPLLAPLFMVRKEGRESGFRTAMHTAYDWFGSHEFQHYFTPAQIDRCFVDAGIHPRNVLKVGRRGPYRARKGEFPLTLQTELMPF